MSFLISDAIAAVSTPSAAPSEGSVSILMIAAIFGLFYFMLIRPQSKRAKEHRQLVSNIQKGDEILTTGGVLAKVNDVGEQFIKVTIAEGVEVNLQKNSVTSVLPKGTFKSL